MTKIHHGTIRGRTIEIADDLGLCEGQQVEVQLRLLPNGIRKPGEGYLRTEGALADDTEWDAVMDEIHKSRKAERHSAIPDLGEP
jgi:hypothetical protein